MAFIPLPNGIKVELKFTMGGELMVNVFHVTSVNPLITANLTDVCIAILSAWNDNMKPLQGAGVSLQEIVATDVSEEDGEQLVYVTGLPTAGTATGDLLPANVAVVSSNKSVYTGRSRRGRTYWGGFTEPNMAGSVPVTAVLTGILGFNNDFVTALDGADLVWGVASYVSEGTPRVTALFTPFTAFTVDQVSDSQRRRLPGRGI